MTERDFVQDSHTRTLTLLPGSGFNLPGVRIYPMIQEQALQFAERLERPDFKALCGWLNNFKSRHNLTGATLSGEKGSVNADIVDQWFQRVPGIISDYAPRDNYNADETGLYFRALPDKTLKVRGEECAGGKKSKLRLTAMLCCNMVGEHEKDLVIGKAAKGPCQYY